MGIFKKKSKGFCPKCGNPVDLVHDVFCMRCGYQIQKRKQKKKGSLFKIIIIILIIIAAFVGIRIYLGKPPIPDLSVLKNLTKIRP